MVSRIILITLLLVAGKVSTSKASIDPEVLSSSTVRVIVKKPHGEMSVATGFIWLKPDWVVTALHVLDPEPKSKVIIDYGKKKRLAKVYRVLPKADLVLLEVSRPVIGWQPIKQFKSNKPKYRASVTALGFHHGALAMSTRELLKGYAKPEILKQFLPPYAVKMLSKTKSPHIELPIYYLDGSLLPGFSGAPIFDSEGALIGIGNGGLENGAANVSWVIPANHLDSLIASEHKTIPAALRESSSLFTLDKINAQAKARQKTGWQAPWQGVINSAVAITKSVENTTFVPTIPLPTRVNYHNFQFVKVKTRSLEQFKHSSANPEEIMQVVTLFRSIFGDIELDFATQAFDVYSDAYYGLNIVIPTGTELYTDDDGYLLAKSEQLCQLCFFELQYHARDLNKTQKQHIEQDAMTFLFHKLDEHWHELNEEGVYEEYKDFRQLLEFGGRRYVANGLFANFNEPITLRHEVNYVSIATNRESWLQAQAINGQFNDDYMSQLLKNSKLNCKLVSLTSEQISLCLSLETAFSLLASVHLTGFSNRFNNL
ncbi:hypothetical protein N480_17680 [Pseudoalteromonas luteoviolacea S2607]|uniref:S1 family peptidase n=1 Tax=Pseudoalteromonas luteoviolacea TaxID=43657 RepID=UPI0007B08910|nr:serine protease [Pseudoalteromonas luteoviolacea]KZN36531.1 hypothetical protein N480_17680 [Pseudoalteromonas luteoviolacea S2607]